ncbi:hypothetical protein K1719_013959 [Acacia pycnantha]|nr:hypothetical protein K1719_013959 [Acacia pycnantha]
MFLCLSDLDWITRIFAVFLFVFYLRRGQAGAVEHLILFGFNLVLLGTHRRSKTVEKKGLKLERTICQPSLFHLLNPRLRFACS